MIKSETQLTIHKIHVLRAKGMTYAKIAKELGMSTQNLYGIKRRAGELQMSSIVKEIAEFKTDDPVLKDLLTRASICIIRLTEHVESSLPLAIE